MKTSHLQTCPGAIRCTECGSAFEMSDRVLCDPIRLISFKESVASRHVCRLSRVQTHIRVWRTPSGKRLDVYYSGAMRRLMPA